MNIPTFLEGFNAMKHELACPLDAGMLEPKLGMKDDEVIIYCLSCSWKARPTIHIPTILSDLRHSLAS